MGTISKIFVFYFVSSGILTLTVKHSASYVSHSFPLRLLYQSGRAGPSIPKRGSPTESSESYYNYYSIYLIIWLIFDIYYSVPRPTCYLRNRVQNHLHDVVKGLIKRKCLGQLTQYFFSLFLYVRACQMALLCLMESMNFWSCFPSSRQPLMQSSISGWNYTHCEYR